MKQVIVVTILFYFSQDILAREVNPIKRRGKLNLTNHLLEEKKLWYFQTW